MDPKSSVLMPWNWALNRVKNNREESEMKSAVAITSKIHLNLNLRRNHLYSPLSRSIFLGKAKPVFQSPPLIRTHSSNPNPNPIMASSSKPEQARAPPALPLPTPPVAKAISHFAYFLNLDDCYLCSVVALVFSFIYLFIYFVQFKVGLCQLSVTADKERNIAHARRAIEEAAEKGAKLILLPVCFPSSSMHTSAMIVWLQIKLLLFYYRRFGTVPIRMTASQFMPKTLMLVVMHLLPPPCFLKLLVFWRSL